MDVSTRRRRLVAATVVVGMVGLTRIALGLHYLVDVLAGVAISLVYLAAVFALLMRYRADRVTPIGVIAVAIAAIGVAVSGASPDAIMLAGAAVGTLVAWRSSTTLSQPRVGVRRGLLGLLALCVLGVVVVAFESSPFVAFGASALALALVIALPALAPPAGDRPVKTGG